MKKEVAANQTKHGSPHYVKLINLNNTTTSKNIKNLSTTNKKEDFRFSSTTPYKFFQKQLTPATTQRIVTNNSKDLSYSQMTNELRSRRTSPHMDVSSKLSQFKSSIIKLQGKGIIFGLTLL